jgi:membrane protein DedA with SNARE-associated domain
LPTSPRDAELAILELLQPIVQFITSLISNLGYPGIFGLMILESALVPVPSEIVMPFSGFLVGAGKLNSVAVVLAGSFGNLVGSVLTYYLGAKAGRAFVIKYGRYIFFRQHHLEVTERWFQRYGDRTSFIGRLLPGIRTYVSLPAGIGKMRFGRFVAYTLAGSLLWNTMLTYIGIRLGDSWNKIQNYSVYLDIAAAIAVIAFVIWFIRNSRKTAESKSQAGP